MAIKQQRNPRRSALGAHFVFFARLLHGNRQFPQRHPRPSKIKRIRIVKIFGRVERRCKEKHHDEDQDLEESMSKTPSIEEDIYHPITPSLDIHRTYMDLHIRKMTDVVVFHKYEKSLNGGYKSHRKVARKRSCEPSSAQHPPPIGNSR